MTLTFTATALLAFTSLKLLQENGLCPIWTGILTSIPAIFFSPSEDSLARRLSALLGVGKDEVEEAVVRLQADLQEARRELQKWAGRCPAHPPVAERAELRALVEKWRAEAAAKDTFHATMGIGWKVCANELEAALAAVAERPA